MFFVSMEYFSLGLRLRTRRPVVLLRGFYGFPALLDTGAVLPVWCYDEGILQSCGAQKRKEHVLFGGFGGVAEGTVYRLTDFRVGGLNFKIFDILAHRQNIPAYLILPATAFQGLMYLIDDRRKRLTVFIPEGKGGERSLEIDESTSGATVTCYTIDDVDASFMSK